MNLFDNLHELETEEDKFPNAFYFSKEIDDYLESLGYSVGSTVYHGAGKSGLTRWYQGDGNDTHVALIDGKFYFYYELNVGGYLNDDMGDIPPEAVVNLEAFKVWFKRLINTHEYLFDYSLRGNE